MGTISHDAVIVTGLEDSVTAARHLALGIALTFKSRAPLEPDWAGLISPICHGITNGYDSFLVAPDGSKESWDMSDAGDELRQEIVDRLAALGTVTVVQVKFGDLGEAVVKR